MAFGVAALALFFSAAPPVWPEIPARQKQGSERRVLVVYSYGRSLPWHKRVAAGIDEIIDALPPEQRPSLFEETVDSSRLGDPKEIEVWAAYLAAKYRSVTIDAIITESVQAGALILGAPSLFPDARRYILHFADANAPGELRGTELRYSSTDDLATALKTIVQVLPRTKRIIAIADGSALGKARVEQLRRVGANGAGVDSLEIWDDFSEAELYARAKSLVSSDALFYLPVVVDREGVALLPANVARRLAQVAPVPMFGHTDSLLGTGMAGGYLMSSLRLGNMIGRIAASGDAAVPASQTDYVAATMGFFFDARALKRWEIADEALPRDSVILYREKIFLERYWAYIAGLSAAFALETFLILALVRTNKQRLRALVELTEERSGLERKVLERTAELKKANSVLGVEIETRKTAEAKEQASSRETEVLLKELQHRVKNSMSIIAALIGLEEGRTENPETAETLSKLGSRVSALSALYDMLYSAGETGGETKGGASGTGSRGVMGIDLDDYLAGIVEKLAMSLGADAKGVTIAPTLDRISIDIKRAVPLGLIANELVTNAFKRAFPENRGGTVSIRLERKEGSLLFEVSDDGIGLPAGFDPEESRGFGMVLVLLLAKQLGATLSFASEPGAGSSFRLSLPA